MKLGMKLISIFLSAVLISIIFPFIAFPPAQGDLINPGTLSSHSTIVIIGNSQFISGNGVKRGNGTEGNPFIIENWSIDATYGNGIWIQNTTKFFKIRNCYIYNGTNDANSNHGIFLRNVTKGFVEYNRIINNYHGILIYYSKNITILNNTCSLHYRKGIYCWASNNNTIANNNCTSNNDGIYCRNSDDNIISNNTCTLNMDGIICWVSNNNTISNNTLNNNIVFEISIRNSNNNIISRNNCSSIKSNGIYCWSNSDSNIIKNNYCSLNKNQSSSQDLYGIAIVSSCDNNKLFNNSCDSYNYGIHVGGETNIISNNKCNSNYKCGIDIFKGSNNNIINNICNFNNKSGINIQSESNNNLIMNNTCNSNNESGIRISGNSNTITNNICNSNSYSLLLTKATNSIIKSNTMSKCSILIEGNKLEYWNTHIIDITNTVNSKPVYYWKNKTSGIVPEDAGEIILANCQNVKISKQNITSSSIGILLGYTDKSTIINSSCSYNINGIQLFFSKKNIFDNCSIHTNLKYDFNIEYYSEKNVVLNSTFDTIFCDLSDSEVIIQNYLHIQVIDSIASAVENVDVEVKDNDNIIYSTLSYGGNCSKTDSTGQIKWITVTDRVYSKGQNIVTENNTMVSIEYPRSVVNENNREVNMSISHSETFIIDYIPNHLPDKIILQSPLNNSCSNHYDPLIKWKVETDEDGDPLTYYLQIDEYAADWKALFWSEHTEFNDLRNCTERFQDGSYQWRVRAHDGIGNGSWSDVWKFTIDATTPMSEITLPVNNGIYNHLDRISGLTLDPNNGTGVNNVNINIKRLSDNLSWDGLSWGSIETWLNTTGLDYWHFDTNNTPWVTDNYYTIRSRATDNINNIEILGSGITFMYDNRPPDISIVINNGDRYTNSTSVILSLTALDSGSGLEQIAFSTDNSIWSVWEQFNSSKPYELSMGDGETFVYFKARDKANNTEFTNDKIILDTTPPVFLSILINLGVYETNLTKVTLELNAVDTLTGVDQMAFSNNGIDWSDWEPFMSERSFTLPPLDGLKTIYFKVKDGAGNIAESVNATIFLNTSKPPSKSDTNPIPEEESSVCFNIWVIILIIIFILIVIISIAAVAVAKRKKYSSHDLPFKEINTHQSHRYYETDITYKEDYVLPTPKEPAEITTPGHTIPKTTQPTQPTPKLIIQMPKQPIPPEAPPPSDAPPDTETLLGTMEPKVEAQQPQEQDIQETPKVAQSANSTQVPQQEPVKTDGCQAQKTVKDTNDQKEDN